MDNVAFDVRGETITQLTAAINLYLSVAGWKGISGWKFLPEKGLVFYWSDSEGVNPFPCRVDASTVASMFFNWRDSDQAKKMKLTGTDEDADHDGSNKFGWRMYVENWGRIDGETYSMFAITPSYLWYGK